MDAGAMEEVSLDQDFLTRFSCMGTEDKDVLISELHRLLDAQLSREGCAFFLEMTNWNLQAAVGAFYDYYSMEGGVLPEMSLVGRKSLGGQQTTTLTLLPNIVFTETWTLRNTGTMPWPLGVHLTLKAGQELCHVSNIHLPLLPPDAETSVSVEFRSPPTVGLYHGQWRACTGGGALFGDPVWVIVNVVEDDGVSGLANQLSSITTHEGEMETEGSKTETKRFEQNVATNPFASPSLCQEHSLGLSSMNTSSSQTAIENSSSLPQSPTPSHTPSQLSSITAQHDTISHSSPTAVSNQNQVLELNSAGIFQEHRQSSTASAMEDISSSDNHPG